uniref:alpha/beta hydrolase n=1 Tax=uncultured Sphingomonas sp. TaxID=158754 RepID=UPI0035CA27CB
MTSDNRFSRWMGRRLTRLIPSARVDGVLVEHRRVAPKMRLYRPRKQRTRAALLWMHGGGFMMGAPAMDDRFCAETCQSLGIVVASIEYRFAPEHPVPAAMNDAHAAWNWLQASADSLGIDADRIAVGGQSAGGGLAAGLIQRIHDTGGVSALAQWLFSPMLDDRTVDRHELDTVGHRIWNNGSNRIGWRAYLGREPGAADPPPYAAPARRDHLRGLPPAWIGVGDIDLFFDEDRAYADRLCAAEVDTRFVTVPGAPHGFESWASKTNMARTYLADARGWLAQQVGVAPDDHA